jgi:hypothetical protein
MWEMSTITDFLHPTPFREQEGAAFISSTLSDCQIAEEKGSAANDSARRSDQSKYWTRK